jgi:imidazolonepropionase-like amidohydrolase
MTTRTQRFIATTILAMAITGDLVAQQAIADTKTSKHYSHQSLLIKADTLFDGTKILNNTGSGWSVLVQDGKIAQVGPANQINAEGAHIVDVPGGTILPGFIDMHTHHILNGVPPRRMLEHGVTTTRDLGGAVTPVSINQPYQLRQFTSGQILSKHGGYPNNVFAGSGVEVADAANARSIVDSLVKQGASVIAVSLEEGGEPGAPWMLHEPVPASGWPTLSDAELSAVIDQAHNHHHVRVTAYLGNELAAQRALDFGVDEWAHMPCDPLSNGVIAQAVKQGVAIDGTIDTEAQCAGVHENTVEFIKATGKLFYATDMGHPDIPHGIDAQEIHMELHAGMHSGMLYPDALTQALVSATSEAGEYLRHNTLGDIVPGVPANLGQIVEGAPADIIVIGSDVRASFKELEFPRLVVKGGLVVIERAKGE